MLLRWRRWLVAAAALVAAVPLLLVLVHLPPVRAWALAAAVARVRSGFGVDLSAERLDYNLVTLTVRLRTVRLAAARPTAGAPAEPFFEADEVIVNLPWSAVTGRPGFERIVLDAPRVTIARDANGALNLPTLPERDGRSAPRERVAIGSILVDNGRVRYADEARDISVDLAGLSVDLNARPDRTLAGKIDVAGPIAIEARGRPIEIEPFVVAPLTVIDSGITAQTTLNSPLASIDLRATIDTAASPPSIDGRYALGVQLDELSSWLDESVHLDGYARLWGEVSGSLADPLVTLNVTDGQVRDRRPSMSVISDVRATGQMTTDRVDIASFEARTRAGSVAGKGSVGFAPDAAGELSVTWRNVPIDELLDAAGLTRSLSLRSRLAGRLEASWPARRVEALRIDLDNTTTASDRSADLQVAGRTTLVVRDGTWRLAHRGTVDETAVSGDATGRLDVEDIAGSTLAGALRVSAPDLGPAIAGLVSAGLPLGALASLDPRGRLDAEFALGGQIGAPSLDGPVKVDGFAVLGAAPGALAARVTLDATRATAGDIDVRAGGAHLTGAVTARFDRTSLDGRVQADLGDAAGLLAGLDARWRPTGAATVAATIGGTFDLPVVEATVASDGLDVAGQRVDRLRASLGVRGSTLTVASLDIGQAGGGSLAAHGRYDFDTRAYAIELEGSALDVEPIPPGDAGGDRLAIAAEADVRFTGEGTMDEPTGNGTIELRRLTWNDGVVGPARAKLAIAGGRLTIDAEASDLGATIDGVVGLAAPHAFTLTGELVGADLGRLIAALAAGEPHVGGTLALGLNASGRLDDLDATDAWVYLRRFEARHERGVLALARPATIRYDRGAISAEALELGAGETTMSLSGRLARSGGAGRVDLKVDGRLEDLTPFVPALADRDDLDLAGAIGLRVTASGSSERPDIIADLDLADGRVAAAGLPPAAAIGVKAAYRDGILEVSGLRGVWQGAVFTGAGRLPARLLADWLPPAYLETLPAGTSAARLTARVEALTRAVLEPWVSAATLAEVNLSSSASLTLEADRPALDALRGEIVFDRMSASAAGVAIAQATPTRLTLEGGRLRVADLTWTAEGARTTVTGEVGLVDRRLDLLVTGTTGLRAVGAFFPTVAVGGTAAVDVRVGGTLDDPQPVGRVALSGGALRVGEPRLVVADLAGVVDLARGRLTTAGLKGTLNGGAITIAGELATREAGGATGRLTLTGRAIALEAPQGLRTEVDADLALALAAGAPQLSGKVTVRRGAYRDTVVITAQLLDRLARRSSDAVDLGTASALDDLRLDVSVVTASPIVLDNNYGRAGVESDLRIGGTLGRPALGGRLTLQEGGQLFLGGRTYQIERGAITFVDPTAIEPDLDLAARTQVGGHDIRLTASGTPDALETTLTSETDPSLGQADLLSLLLTGETADKSGALVSADTGVQVLQLLSGDILGLAGRVVGLDSVRLEQGTVGDLFGTDPALVAAETDPGQRLSISKNLSSQVEIVLSQKLKGSGGVTWIAVYHPTPTLELRAVSRDDNSRSLQMSQQLQFGGGAIAVEQTAAPAPPPLVESVRLTGVPDADRSQVGALARTKAGERLDFYRWQEDRDRIEQYFHDRGYYEARVTVERTDAGDHDPRVAVEYRIERGPRTRLEVDGFSLPDGARRDIARAWEGAVFDGFLIDDARARLRRALARQGYVQPTVTAQVNREGAGEAEVKVLQVTVDPGPRTPNLQVRFSGNAAIPAERLDAEVQRRGLGLAAWLRPRDFEQAMAEFCRRQGLLAATVSVGTPRFDGGTATLPVTVDEGPVFLVGDVGVTGEAAKTAAEVRAAFGLSPGDSYTPDAVDAGQRQVDAAYRRDGFNRAVVRVGRDVDRDTGRVALSLDVTEGPRQVLSGIEIEGEGPTRQGLLDQAIHARVGEPVVADDWFQARRRLYETGVFRSVDVAFEPAGEPTERGGVTVQPTRARVSLVPVPLYRFRYGFEIADEIAPAGEGRQNTAGFIADLQRRNLLGRALTVGGTSRFEADLWVLRGFASMPRFFTLPLTSSVYVSRSHQQVSPPEGRAFDDDRWIVTTEQSIRRGRAINLSWGYRYERNHVFDPESDPDDLFPLDFTVNIARLTSALTFDTRDDPFAPRRGWFAGTTLEYAVPSLGSDLDFVKLLTQGYYFRALGPVVLASAARLGGVFGPDSLNTERFVTGGGTTVRGYAQDTLGPVDFFGDVGGKGLLVLNQEARVHVWRWIGAVGFLDAGNAFLAPSDISLAGLKVGVGAGLRLDTPFVLVRVDYGVPVPRPEGSPFGRWYFSLGHVF